MYSAPLIDALFSVCYNPLFYFYFCYCYYYYFNLAPDGVNHYFRLIDIIHHLQNSFPCSPNQSLRRKRGKRSGRIVRSKYISEPFPVLPIILSTASNNSVSKLSHSLPCLSRDIKSLRYVSHIPKESMIKIGLWNARSVNNKVVYVSELILSNSLDILILTETWLTSGKDHTLGLLCDLLPGYRIINQPRHSRGGGLALLLRTDLASKKNTGPSYKSFEYLDVTFTSGKMLLRVVSIYRPPISTKNKLSLGQFLLEFSDFLELIYTSHNKIIIAGDFNIRFDMMSNPETCRFSDILATFDLFQHIHHPTHLTGHTLDLVITKCSNSDSIYSADVFSDAPSDHSYIICNVNFPYLKPSKLSISTRKIRSIKIGSFIESVIDANFGSDTDTLYMLVEKYNSHLRAILDNHAPLISKTLTSRPKSQWYSDHLREIKREVRKLERRYIKNKLIINFDMFKSKCIVYKALLNSAKTAYYREKFGNCDTKKLFQLVRSLSVVDKGRLLPECNSKRDLANTFSAYFVNKVDSLRRKVPEIINHTNFSTHMCPLSLSEFKHLSLVEVRELIKNSKTKSCGMDPIPTSILKQCLETFVEPIAYIINSSVNQSLFPSNLKLSMVIPSIKKNSLNPNDF